MKNLSDNVMSSLGLASGRPRGPKVDPLAAVNKVKSSKKDIKAKAYKAALLDLLYLQVVTGQIPGSQGMLQQQGVTGGYPQVGSPPPMPQQGMPPEMMAMMAGGGAPQGMMG